MSDGVTPKLMLGPLSSLSRRVWQLVSAVMFSGVAVMVSEGCVPGKNQLLTANGVPQHGPLVPGISPPPLPPAAPTAFSCKAFALTVSVMGFANSGPGSSFPLRACFH